MSCKRQSADWRRRMAEEIFARVDPLFSKLCSGIRWESKVLPAIVFLVGRSVSGRR